MPPLKHNGRTVGYYAQDGSAECLDYAGNPELRQMPARTEGEDLGFTLFALRDVPSALGPAASKLLELKGVTNVMVDFIRIDASSAESGSYGVKLYR